MGSQMPELGGPAAAREIRRREAASGRRTPIAAVIASAMKGDHEHCLSAGMDEYLAKPIDEEKPLGVIDRPVGSDPAAEPVRCGAPPAPEPAVFDRERTLSLCVGDRDLAREMVDLFLDTVRGFVADLHAAVPSSDAGAVHRIAHALNGAAANLSGGRVEAVAGRLMEVGAEGRLDEATAILEELDYELVRLERALAAFRVDLDREIPGCAS